MSPFTSSYMLICFFKDISCIIFCVDKTPRNVGHSSVEGLNGTVESDNNLTYITCMYNTTLFNLSMNYLIMYKVYTDVGGINSLKYHDCPPVRKIIHSLKLAIIPTFSRTNHGITIT